MKPLSPDRIKLDIQRKKAAEFFVRNYEREERYLIIFSRDFANYIAAFSAERFKTVEKRESLKWDFFADTQLLIKRIQEFSWTAEKLLENGIDLNVINKILNKVFSEKELDELVS